MSYILGKDHFTEIIMKKYCVLILSICVLGSSHAMLRRPCPQMLDGATQTTPVPDVCPLCHGELNATQMITMPGCGHRLCFACFYTSRDYRRCSDPDACPLCCPPSVFDTTYNAFLNCSAVACLGALIVSIAYPKTKS